MGVQTFRKPSENTEIAAGDAALPARLGGGLYVQLTGLRSNGYAQVRTLKHQEVWIRERQSPSGTSSLCSAHGSVMRVCRKSNAPQWVPVQADFAVQDAAPVASVKRGILIQLWGYFEERGRWTFVETQGKVGFVPSDELCHDGSLPPGEQATKHFGMIAAPAKPDCYQWARERSAAEIRRIVIHNSEATLQRTITLFQECAPEHPRSAHVGIDRDGTIYRFVEDRFTAFHTGGTDSSGGFNSISLGIELIASDQPGLDSMTPQQERSLVDLLRFWAAEYRIAIPRNILADSTQSPTYRDLEYWYAPVSLHRLVSAGRRTDCPRLLWADNSQGDEEFFLWRRKQLGHISSR
jgi:hypothetical protein